MDGLPKLNKQQAMQQLLAAHNSIYVHVDTRRSGVMLPPSLMGRPQVALQIGLHLPIPIRDLSCDPDGWSATLSFGSTLFFCALPWAAVYFIVSETGIGYHWPSDTPPEVVVQHREDAARAAAEKKAAKDAPTKKAAALAVAKARGWGVVEGGKKDVSDDGKEAS